MRKDREDTNREDLPAVRVGLIVDGSLPLAAAKMAVMGIVQFAKAPTVPTKRTTPV